MIIIYNKHEIYNKHFELIKFMTQYTLIELIYKLFLDKISLKSILYVFPIKNDERHFSHKRNKT